MIKICFIKIMMILIIRQYDKNMLYKNYDDINNPPNSNITNHKATNIKRSQSTNKYISQ
jgi:uncharacterized radical SAM superfamily Fe-S cluster-containing enzyme